MSPEWPGFESSVCESLSTSLGGVILSPHMPNRRGHHADHNAFIVEAIALLDGRGLHRVVRRVVVIPRGFPPF